MDSLSGTLLVAAPGLTDPNFNRTVILVLEHGTNGALGLVLNRPGTRTLPALWDEEEHGPCPVDLPVMTGGPLVGPLMVLYSDGTTADREVVPGVSFAMGKDVLAPLVADASRPVRVFAGYAGWGGGQLEEELRGGAWMVTTATAPFVFGDADVLWDRVSRRVADERLVSTLRVRHVPEEPWYN